MALIKSALELALEKTKDLKYDEKAVEANELKTEGKKLAGLFIDGSEEVDLAAKLASFPESKRATVKAAIVQILLSHIQLPSFEGFEEKTNKIFAGLLALTPATKGGPKQIQNMAKQVISFLTQYITDMRNVEQMIRKQWAPRFKEKERQLAAKLGQAIRIDPMTDPEFVEFYQKNIGSARTQYQQSLDKAKADILEILEIESE